MSVAAGKNPIPPKVWAVIRFLLRTYGVEVVAFHTPVVTRGAVDEYETFAALYWKSTIAPAPQRQSGLQSLPDPEKL